MNFFILLIMTFLGAFASVFFKKMSSCESIFDVLKSRNLYLGVGLYLMAAILNIYILSIMNYSKVLPLTSLTYFWTMILSNTFFSEHIGIKKIVGVSFICLGALLVANV